MKKLVKPIFILLLISLVISQLILPQMFADKVESSLQEELDEQKQLQVKINSFPAVKLLLGYVDTFKISGTELVVNKLPISSLRADFNKLKLVQEGEEWEIKRGINNYLDLQLTEKGINDYLATKPELDFFEKFKVELNPEQVIILGSIKIFNAQVNLQLTGDFAVVEGTKVVFKSDQLAVENLVIPTSLIEQLKDKLQFEINFAKLPFPVQIKQVNLQEDGLQILGVNAK